MSILSKYIYLPLRNVAQRAEVCPLPLFFSSSSAVLDGGHIDRFLQAFFVRRQLSVGYDTDFENIAARGELFKFRFLYNDFIIKRTRQSKSLLL